VQQNKIDEGKNKTTPLQPFPDAKSELIFSTFAQNLLLETAGGGEDGAR